MNRQELINNIRRKGTFLCVGLDTDIRKIPECIKGSPAERVAAFNRAIIDATAPYCVAYKPNIAFYEALGAEGWQALADTVGYLRANHPDQFIIADAKRGDIGNTAALYARTFFETYDFDAVTLAPYMGSDSVKPFLDYDGRWSIVLALTSNASSADFETVTDADGTPLYQRVISTSQQWDGPDKIMYVVGATKAEFFADIRRLAPRSFLLVPGVGAQGGSLEGVCRHGMIEGECGLLVNSSRAIIYASSGADFAEAAAGGAKALAAEMASLLSAHGVL